MSHYFKKVRTSFSLDLLRILLAITGTMHLSDEVTNSFENKPNIHRENTADEYFKNRCFESVLISYGTGYRTFLNIRQQFIFLHTCCIIKKKWKKKSLSLMPKERQLKPFLNSLDSYSDIR